MKAVLSSANLLPLLDARQLSVAGEQHLTFRLDDFDKRSHSKPPVVGTYDRTTRWAKKRFTHEFKKGEGIGLNLEMLALLDREQPPPRGVRMTVDYQVLEVDWVVVLRYAQHPEYRLRFDTDEQVLIPWTAWEGREFGPPA